MIFSTESKIVSGANETQESKSDECDKGLFLLTRLKTTMLEPFL